MISLHTLALYCCGATLTTPAQAAITTLYDSQLSGLRLICFTREVGKSPPTDLAIGLLVDLL